MRSVRERPSGCVTGNPSSSITILRTPKPLLRFVASKGSVALDGISLTVNEVKGDEFGVLVIPHTVAVTAGQAIRPGTDVNIEVDLMARYAARLAEKSAAL